MRISYYFLLALLFFSVYAATAQQSAVSIGIYKDQLAALGNTDADNRNKVNILCNMAAIYVRTDMDSCRDVLVTAHRLSKQINYPEGQARAVLCLANVDYSVGKSARATEGYAAALALYRQLGAPQGQAACLSNLGLIATQSGKLDTASLYLTQAIEIYKKMTNASQNTELGIAYMNRALNAMEYADVTNLSDIESDLKEAMSIVDKMNNSPLRVSVYLAMGNCLERQKRTTEGLGFGLKALQIAREQGDLHGIAESYTHLSSVYINKKDYTKALSYLSEAETTFEKIEDKVELAIVYVKKGDVLMLQNTPKEAIEAYKKVLPILKRMESPTQIQATYKGLAAAYTALGDKKNAEKYQLLLDEAIKESQMVQKE